MKKILLSLGLITLAAPVFAHPGHGLASGFLPGLIHPLTGADHLSVMLAVGLWSGFAMPRHVWIGAATFLSAMLIGAGLGWAHVALPAVEAVILASVIAMGLLTITARDTQPRALTSLSLIAIATFAAFHGHAHATEATGAAALFIAGFITSTTALHLTGIAVAKTVASSRHSLALQRILGGAITLTGLWLALG